MVPSMGGRWGGQRVTVTGSGFDTQTSGAMASAARVFVGGRQAPVRSASYGQLVFETPALADPPAIGLEHERVWTKIRHCHLPGPVCSGSSPCVSTPFGCSGRNCSKNLTGSTTGPTTTLGEECVGHGLRACAAKRSWGFVAAADAGLPPMASNNRILALPGSDSRSADAALVDGDLETVWRSKPGSDSLKLVVDLGPQDIVVKKLRIHWAGRAAAAEYRISASGMDPSACDADLEELVAWTTSSMAPFHRTGTALALTVATWRITGHPWFVVDWKSAEGNILFRFNPNSADQQIIMNSYLVQNEDGKDKWHTENRVSYMGTSEQTWTVTVDDIGFHVLSGGQEVFVYAHRLALVII